VQLGDVAGGHEHFEHDGPDLELHVVFLDADESSGDG
jgi:hypothetical protein